MSDQKKAVIPPLFSLPFELRLPIYKELLAPSDESDESERVLCSCRHCQMKRMYGLQARAGKAQRPIFPAILATNRMIYEEGMITLYGENSFLIVCSGISTAPSNRRIPPFYDIKSLVVSESGIRNAYLKRVSLSFACPRRGRKLVEDLPSMWSTVEPMILDSYPSIERIRLGFFQGELPRCVRIIMTQKQQQKPKGRIYADKYFDTLKMRRGGSNWQMKRLCNIILSTDLPELIGGSAFTVQSLQWNDSQELGKIDKLTREILFN